MVLLTDHHLAERSNLPQTPAWTGDDTLKVSPKAHAAAQSPVSSIAGSLRSQEKPPSLFLVSVITAIIAGAAAYGVIMVIEHFKNRTDDTQIISESINNTESETSMKPVALSQEELMAQAATIASQIEPSSVNATDEILEADDSTADMSPMAKAELAQDEALKSFQNARPLGELKNLIKADTSLPAPVKKIETEAFKGNAAAQHDLAAIYTAGHGGVQVDYARAMKWFAEAAYNGSANAQYNLGVLYHQGLGVSKDTAKAIEMYRVAASNNHPEALYNLAIAYVEGVGVEYDPQIAANYFERSASGGIVEAAYNLGLLHDNGLLGESQPDEAVFWYKIAADKGNQDAQKALGDLKQKLSMTNEDVERIVQKIVVTKPDFKNEDGLITIPEQVKSDISDDLKQPKIVEKPVAKINKPVAKPVPKVDAVIVSQIQEQLMRLGLYKGIPDGTMSPVLSQSIRDYQTKNGLKSDGQPSDDLLVQMLASSASSAKPAP